MTITPPSPRFRPLSRHLIRRIIALAAVAMLLAGGAKARFTYQQVRQDFEAAVQQVASYSLQALSLALWDIEVPAVRRQVDWLASLPELGWVRVEADVGELFTAGDPHRADQNSRMQFEILAPNGISRVGTLELLGDRERLVSAILRAVLLVCLEYLAFATLICLAVSWTLKRELQAPLELIARFAQTLRPGRLTQPLPARPHSRHQQDEIDLVAQGITRLQTELRAHIETLDHTVEARTRELNALVTRMHHRSITDPLTGCYNRHLLDERLPAEIQRSIHYARPLSVLFVDLDHFKRINDAHGHSVGDEVLRSVCQRLQAGLRPQIDWLARYGGEEFVVVLPERDLAGAMAQAEQLRAALSQNPLSLTIGQFNVTASFGVAELRPGERQADWLARADACVYAAKHAGRDCVMTTPLPLRANDAAELSEWS